MKQNAFLPIVCEVSPHEDYIFQTDTDIMQKSGLLYGKYNKYGIITNQKQQEV